MKDDSKEFKNPPKHARLIAAYNLLLAFVIGGVVASMIFFYFYIAFIIAVPVFLVVMILTVLFFSIEGVLNTMYENFNPVYERIFSFIVKTYIRFSIRMEEG